MSENVFPNLVSATIEKSTASPEETFAEGAKVKIEEKAEGVFDLVVSGKNSVLFPELDVQGNTLVQRKREPHFLVGRLQHGSRQFLCGVLLKPKGREDTPTGVWTGEVDRK